MNRFRLVFALALGLSCATAVAQTTSTSGEKEQRFNYRFRMIDSGTQAGTVGYIRIMTPKTRRTILTIDGTDQGVTLNAVIDTTSDRNGNQQAKAYHGVLSGHPFSLSGVFDDKGVTVTIDSNGKKTTEVKAKPANASLRDESELWFDTVIPKQGDKASFTNFNIQSGTWEQTTTTFVGDETIKIKDKSYATHHIHVKADAGEIDIWVDDHGDPVAMNQLGSVRLERVE